MIKFREQVPSVYSDASRDFQYIGWLINIVLNSVKHNIDDLYDLPNVKADYKLTELLAMTLGFKVKRNYDQKQLAALVAVLPRILKYKGTKIAVDMAGNALIAASGAPGGFSCSVTDGELTARLPKDLIDISLFTDLLPYILPAGMTCRILRENTTYTSADAIELAYSDIMHADFVVDLDFANNDVFGLAKMYLPGEQELSFANFFVDNNEISGINTGLMSNAIIPMLAQPITNNQSGAATEPSVLSEPTTDNIHLDEIAADDTTEEPTNE